MSYDIEAIDTNGNVIMFEEKHNYTGGTYAVGGTEKAWLNITYNYAEVIDRFVQEGINGLDGNSVRICVGDLTSAVVALNDDVAEDYWEPTEGNVKAALKNLLHLAVDVLAVCPDARWRIC